MLRRTLSPNLAVGILILTGITLSVATYYFTVKFLKSNENILSFLPSPSEVNIYILSANFPQILMESDKYINLNNLVITLTSFSNYTSYSKYIIRCLYTNTTTIVLNTTNGKFVTVNITKGRFSCFSQSCIPPGDYNVEVYYGGFLKDVYSIKIGRYVCLNAKIDYIKQRIVGYAHWNTGEPYNGRVHYEIDKGTVGEGDTYTTNGYFEISNVTFNFTYLLPLHSWQVKWSQDLPYRGYSFVPAHLCVSSTCVDSYYIIRPPNTNPNIPNYYYREIKVEKITPHYIVLNFTYVFVPSYNINFSPSEEGYSFFIVHSFPFDKNRIRIEKCGSNISADCRYGIPIINIVSNASGKTYHYPSQQVIYQKITIWNNGSIDFPVGGVYWWKYNDGNKLWLNSVSYKQIQQLRAKGKTGNLIKTSVDTLAYRYIIPPHSKIDEIWELNLTKVEQYLNSYYDGLSIKNKTFEINYEYPGVFDYRFRFAINKPTVNPTITYKRYPIKNSYLVEFKYKQNITHPIKVWFVVNFTRLNKDYVARVAVYQWLGFINIVRNLKIIKTVNSYMPFYGSCAGWWSCTSFVKIPSTSRTFWRFYYMTINKYSPGNNIFVTHNLIIANTGLNVLSDVSVFKIIERIYWLRNWIGYIWYNQSIIFDYTPPSGFNIYKLFGYIYIAMCRSSSYQYIHFEIPGYHNEVLNCTKDPNSFSCNPSLACKSNDGKCYSKVWYSVLSSKMVWVRGRIDVPLTKYYEDTHQYKIHLIYNITGNYTSSSNTLGYKDIKLLAEFVQKDALWKNHMRHSLILMASNTIYQYQFTT